INIKFISGVVEKEGELFIILDVIRIFTQTDEEKQKPRGQVLQDTSRDAYFAPAVDAAAGEASEAALGFIKETLTALKHFSASPLNETWLRQRFSDWASVRTGEEMQLKNDAEATEFLAPFYSPGNGQFWNEDYAAAIKNVLPELTSNNIQVWNLGCGKGYETFSFACILKARYPDGRIKIWANDNDIMAISQAPNMIFDLDEVPEYCRAFMVRGRNGYSFNQVIKDSLLFEYHDILNENPLPELDIILARDLLSFLSVPDQERIIDGFAEKLKGRGMVILGRNEHLTRNEWKTVGKDPVSAFTR
ncbi:MAG: chemotaxis protein CheW, partial [Spirochaetaceae bacterium]|nr:chemotaxis protein CheW [Spirochaetaceae bacterium]